MNAFITDIAKFMPNQPVDNDRMEEVLGKINGLPSRTRKIILRNNGIKQRYYAIDPVTGKTTHTNAELAAMAVRNLSPYHGFAAKDIELLCCGTSAPDLLMPGHASMVHGELGGSPCEIVSTAGICLSGITCLKYAAMSVSQGLTQNAVATGSEQASSFMRARMSDSFDPQRAADLEKQPALAFEADFLRWMLSDGAGALFLSSKPTKNRLNLRIDWIDITSYANEMETCMYAGGVKNASGKVTGWREFDSLQQALEARALLVKQDAKLLNSKIIPITVTRSLAELVQKRNLKPTEIDWFLPHYSSQYFRGIVDEQMKTIGFHIPQERWFTNLVEMGNTGAASIYIILEELLKSDRLKKNDRLLCYIPESGRFSVGYMQLTVV